VVCALGDLLLDVVVRLDASIAADTDTYGRTRVAPGGQAANVAAWVAALGGRSRFVGKRAQDAAGRMLAAELRRVGVDVVGPEVAEGTGTVVSLADPAGRRSMLTDRGVAPELGPAEIDPAWCADLGTLHLPAYSLVRTPIRDAALHAAALARRAGARVSVDLSGTRAIAELGAERFRHLVHTLRPDVVFGTQDEMRLVGAIEADVLVEKRGARGCVVRRAGDERVYEAKPTELVDTTGAGDALAAGFLLAGPDLGLRAAARCVATMGAFPR
jgi:ribokinase